MWTWLLIQQTQHQFSTYSKFLNSAYYRYRNCSNLSIVWEWLWFNGQQASVCMTRRLLICSAYNYMYCSLRLWSTYCTNVNHISWNSHVATQCSGQLVHAGSSRLYIKLFTSTYTDIAIMTMCLWKTATIHTQVFIQLCAKLQELVPSTKHWVLVYTEDTKIILQSCSSINTITISSSENGTLQQSKKKQRTTLFYKN